MYLNLKIFLLLISLFILNCSEKTYISGKVLNNDIEFENIKNKEELIKKIGNPSFIDPVENKFYYFNEMMLEKNVLSQKLKKRTILVYTFNNNEIISFNQFNLDDNKDLKFVKNKTKSAIIKRGFIEKTFGGVGTKKISNTP